MQTLIFDCHNRDYKQEYRAYLETPHWKNYRARQLRRFHCCVFCWYFYNKIITQREVHHLTYANRNHERDTDTVILCRKDHEEVKTIPVSMLLEAREAYKLAYPEHKT